MNSGGNMKKFLMLSILSTIFLLTGDAKADKVIVNIYNGTGGSYQYAPSYQPIQVNTKRSKYDYLYDESYVPRQSGMTTNGYFLTSRSNIRYVTSPSKLKREKHRERIMANNRQYGYYY